MHWLLRLETSLWSTHVALEVQYGKARTADQSGITCIPGSGLRNGILPTVASAGSGYDELVNLGVWYHRDLGCGVLLCMGKA